MIEVQRRSTHHLALGFALGAALTALVMVVGTAFAQTPTPMPAPNVAQMIEWCRQMMAQIGSQTQGIMGSMQGMMSGTCPMTGH